MVVVSAVLVGAIIFTGFISSAYKTDRVTIGHSHFQLAQSLVKQGSLDEGIEQYRKALIFSPDQTDYRLALATALMKSGRTDEAQSHLEQLVQENPTDGLLNLMLARLAVKEHKIDQALDYYQRAVYEYWPPAQIAERRKARWELIGLLGSQGKRVEMVAELMQLYANAPPDPDLRAKVGFELLQNGATSEAMQVFSALTQQAPAFPAGHKGLAEAYFSIGNYVASRHELQKAMRLDASDKETGNLLQLTNSVIDLDPDVPHIDAGERLRRSKSLLSRIIGDLQSCSGGHALPGDVLQGRLQAGASLLAAKNQNGDLAFELQDMAQQLWSDSAQYCSPGKLSDPVSQAVLTHIGNE